ncbi:MAG TPA: HK97 family phage prohead protease [Vicinamibacterales bacterium]|nr:HK97 family phage prohead protease [Vicinamibacterales bacterium]
MQHVTKAVTEVTTTDLGEFTAIAAAYTLDRSGDEIVHGAFGKSIAKWQASGKRVPLHWNHSGAAADIIGSVDSSSMEEIDGVGLKVAGKVDVNDSAVAKEAWRSMKGGSMSLSFGYMVVDGSPRKDGVNELRELDLFEVSIVPVPANPDTKILSMKSADGAPITAEQKLQELEDRLNKLEQSLETEEKKEAEDTDEEPAGARHVDQLSHQAKQIALEVRSGGLSTNPPALPVVADEPKPDLAFEPDELRKYTRDLVVQSLLP